MKDWTEMERAPAPAIIPQFGPLTGVRVLMTGSVVAGPVAGTIFAEFGAEVIHVEMPGVGDTLRTQAPIITHGDDGAPFKLSPHEVPRDQKISGAWMQEGRNKLSFTLRLDMRIPESKQIFYGLIKNCDVWIENMVWIEKFGITDADVLAANPKIVIAHISGFGRPQFGGVPEDCDRPSYDPIGQCEGGWAYMNGFPDSSPMVAAKYPNDYATAVTCCNGVMMALYNAQKTGKGQVVDVAQIEVQTRNLNDSIVNYTTIGHQRGRVGSRSPIFQPAGLYQTKDNYIFVGTFGEISYDRSLRAMGFDPAQYPYLEAGGSMAAVSSPLGKKLDAAIAEWMMQHTSDEALAVFKKAKIAAGVPRKIEEVVKSEHYHKRGDFITYKDETLGKEITAFGIVPKMSDTKPMVWRGAPKLGQDTENILKTILGYSDADVAALRGKKAID